MRLKFVQRLWLLTLIPMIGFIYFGLIHIKSLQEKKTIALSTKENIESALKMSTVVHYLQQERGFTNLYLKSENIVFEENMLLKRNKVDSCINLLNYTNNIWNPVATNEDQLVSKLSLIRKSISNEFTDRDVVFSSYSKLIMNYITQIKGYISIVSESESNLKLSKLLNIIILKEQFGIERAKLSAATFNDSLTRRQVVELSQIILNQRSWYNVVTKIGSSTSDEISKINSNPNFDQLTQLENEILLNKGVQIKKYRKEPGFWFKLFTAKINLIRNLELSIDRLISSKAKVNFEKANELFIVFSIGLFSTVAASVLLLIFFLKKILNQIGGEPLEVEQAIQSLKVGGSHKPLLRGDKISGIYKAAIELEDVLKKQLRSIENQNKELDQFVYAISHDLKVPLRGIATLSQFLEEDLRDNLTAEDLSKFKLINERAEQIQNLINGLISYSQIGNQNQQTFLVDTKKTLIDCIKDLDLSNGFNIDMKGDYPQINVNPIYINQLYTELISNAINYNDKQEGKLNISSQYNSSTWTITFADNGPGIEEQYKEKVFHMFQRLSDKKETERIGIGLTIVNKIVQFLEGEVALKTGLQQGATFVITVPIK